MATKSCGLCFERYEELVPVSLLCEDNLTVLQKLEKVAPFQDWVNCNSVCRDCKNLLDTSYRFIDMCTKYHQNKRDFLKKEKEKRLKTLELSNSKNDSARNSNNIDLHEHLNDTLNDIFGKGSIEAEYVKLDDIIDEEQFETEFITIDVKGPEIDVLGSSPSKNACDNKGFGCALCGKQFSSIINLEIHYRFVEHGYSEEFIDNSLNTIRKDKHSRSTRKFLCEACNKTFSYEKMFIRHCETQHSMAKSQIRPFSCTVCPKRLASSSSFKRHLLYHERIKRFTCTFCGKGFVMKKDLDEHEKIHLNEKNYRCQKCDKSFNTYANLRTHNFNVHTDPSEWKHLCNFWPKRFAMKGTLDEHLKRHQGIKDHQCLSCGLCFTTKYCLERHMYTHTKDRPHKCQWCPDRSYRDRKRLEIHMIRLHDIEMQNK